jgi:hypothetical protein
LASISIEVREVDFLPGILTTGFGHLYLVFNDGAGAETVVRGGPEGSIPGFFGDIETEAGTPILLSDDARGGDTPAERAARPLDLGGRSAGDVWNIMLQQAQNIEDEGLPYLVFDQNSNSTVASVLNVVGLDPLSNMPTTTLDLAANDNLLEFDYSLDGTAAADILRGVGGNDSLAGAGGDDSLVGGAGDDVAIFRGAFAEYQVLRVDDRTVQVVDTVAGRDATDTLTDFEFGQFADQRASLSASPAPDGELDIYRFYNVQTKTHFYTASAEERDFVLRSFPQFQDEGNRFDASADPAAGVSIFRFYNTQTQSHFYTASAAERDFVQSTFSQFQFEGVAYHAWADDGGGAYDALYRFYNTETQAHFYTNSAEEKASIEANLPQFKYENVAYYVDAAI